MSATKHVVIYMMEPLHATISRGDRTLLINRLDTIAAARFLDIPSYEKVST